MSIFRTTKKRTANAESTSRLHTMAKKKTSEPKIIRPDDIDPHYKWDRPLQAPGHTQVDFEERVNFRRLHDYRLARTRAALANSGLGALLCFDQHNIRYMTSTVIGEWARDKLTRYSLLTGNGDPYIWDFGSAAQAPSPACTVAASRPLPRGIAGIARRCRWRHRAVSRRGARNQIDPRRGRGRQDAAGPRCRRAADAVRIAESWASKCAMVSKRCCRRAK